MAETKPDPIQWQDFDDPTVYEELKEKCLLLGSKNFVLEFDSASSMCAFDLDAAAFSSLLSRDPNEDESSENTETEGHTEGHLKTRWINIWVPETQRDVLKLLARQYGFSPRLLASFCCRPNTPIVTPGKATSKTAHGFSRRKEKPKDPKQSGPANNDVEKNEPSPSEKNTFSPLDDLNHYYIVDQVWHYASIDWGRKYTCIGYNSLHQVRPPKDDPDDARHSEYSIGPPAKDGQSNAAYEKYDRDYDRKLNKPAGTRLWTWLVLCGDRTVISINETPNTYTEESKPSVNEDGYDDSRYVSQKDMDVVRHNLFNVFQQLSRANKSNASQNPMMTTHIRPEPLKEGLVTETPIKESDSASLLLYYLFDDWITSYRLVSRSEHQYGRRLEKVRRRMFTNGADISNANRLHHFGRQLSVLKRLYESYIRIIERLLRGPHQQENGQRSDTLARVTSYPMEASRTLSRVESTFQEYATGFGIQVSTAAAFRFERLRDRIDLYALSEIQDCLDEKESLVMLNFNLIAMRESSYIERLTRITILLGKATILFLPVSFMSGYFEVPLVGTEQSYTPKVYWASFAVIFSLSLVGLVVFGWLSGTQEGRPIYKSFTNVMFRKATDARAQRRVKAE